MEWLKLLTAPLIGALIGYCTNYIAVKMLFRPLYPVKIGRVTVPFTPGIIPRRKPALAHAIGNMVGKSLVGEEEIREILTSDTMRETVVDGIVSGIKDTIAGKTTKELAMVAMQEQQYESGREIAKAYITEKIIQGIQSVNIEEIIVSEGTQAVKEMGGMIAMFVNESLISSFAEPIGKKINGYLETSGKEVIMSKVEEEVSSLEGKMVEELNSLENLDGLRECIGSMYESMINKEIVGLVSAFDICTIVEKKIIDMDVKSLEQLIMSVMKNELKVIVNLGALIGFILGLLNLIF